MFDPMTLLWLSLLWMWALGAGLLYVLIAEIAYKPSVWRVLALSALWPITMPLIIASTVCGAVWRATLERAELILWWYRERKEA